MSETAMKPFCEVCCPSLEAVARAVAAGADRIELCERLEVGGVTPSAALIRNALAVAGKVPVNVLIRPREGDFVYSEEETAQMLESIALCKSIQADGAAAGRGTNQRVSGVVIGALRPDGSVDMSLMRQLVAAARPAAARPAAARPVAARLVAARPASACPAAARPAAARLAAARLVAARPASACPAAARPAAACAAADPAGPDALRPLGITFHRAFDECRDPFAALEDIISLGIDRILTSGHCANVWEGRFILKELVERAAGRIVIMPGCGITPANLPEIAAITSAPEFHGSRIL